MATSGSTDFDLDVAEIIEEAYERCGLEVRTGYDAKTARRSMNLMFADWANRGLNLWTVKQATQALTQGTATYTLDANHTDFLRWSLRRSGVDKNLHGCRVGVFRLTKQNDTGSPESVLLQQTKCPRDYFVGYSRKLNRHACVLLCKTH